MHVNILLVLSLVLAGCGEKDSAIRHYEEIAIAPVLPDMAGASVPDDVPARGLKFGWTTPGGWTELPASGMRLATFTVSGAECTIVSFPGDSGGVIANLKRWLGQLNVEVDDGILAAFAEKATTLTSEGGYTVTIFDLAVLLPDGAPAGMLAAIVPVADETVFVKLMGTLPLLASEKAHFTRLCTSLRPR